MSENGRSRKSSLERRFENAVAAGGRACRLRGRSVLCAVSGGADSVALAVALTRRGAALGVVKLGIAHVDHQLRPGSDVEAEDVSKLAEALGVPFSAARVTVDVAGAGLEASARAARYLALEELALREGFDTVATGHTRTDQAETVLLRLLRGAGLRGLGAMASVRRLGSGVRLARPLLGLSGAEVRAYVRAVGAKTFEDPSNQDPAIRRNALRLNAWPALLQLEPTLEVRLAELAHQSREDEAALEALTRAAATTLVHRSAEGVSVAASPLAALPVAIGRRVLRQAIAQLRPAAQPSAVHLRGLLALARRGRGELHVAGDLRGQVSGGQLRLSPRVRGGA